MKTSHWLTIVFFIFTIIFVGVALYFDSIASKKQAIQFQKELDNPPGFLLTNQQKVINLHSTQFPKWIEDHKHEIEIVTITPYGWDDHTLPHYFVVYKSKPTGYSEAIVDFIAPDLGDNKFTYELDLEFQSTLIDGNEPYHNQSKPNRLLIESVPGKQKLLVKIKPVLVEREKNDRQEKEESR